MDKTLNGFQQRDFPFSVKSLDEDLGIFQGHAAAYALDLQNDRIAPGAFKKTLQEAKADMQQRSGEILYAVCWQHDPHNPIGGIFEAYEDSYGLAVKGMLDLDVPEGRRAFSALKKGYMNSFSIGYKPRLSHMEAASGFPGGAGGVRVLDDIELFEVSIVTFPANPQATVTGVKSANDAWLESLVDDMENTVARYGGAKGKNTMANHKDKIGRLYVNYSYSVKRAAQEIGVPEAALQTWVEQDERVNGTVKSLRGSTFVYPAWLIAQVAQSHSYDVPMVSTTSTKASDLGYRLVPGEDPFESRVEFGKELRAQLRTEDDIYMLHGKAFDREVELRKRQREERQRLQREALEAERREQAEKQAAMSRETFTPEQFAQATGLDVAFVRNWFAANLGRVTPVDAGALVLRGQDVRSMAKRDYELLETQAIRARNKRMEGRAA